MDRPYGTRSRKLFQLWTRHDLADHGPEFESYRPVFYEGLRLEDEPAVWEFIEENYRRKYRGFSMPEELTERIRTWQAAMDRPEPGEENPDHETSSAERLEIAREVKLFLGDDYYVEFRPFRKIAVRDGEAVELEVPAFITDLTR